MTARFRPVLRGARFALPLLLMAGAAGAQEPPHHFATLSLWDPISTNANRESSTSLRIALIQSYVGEVRGLDITGISGQLGGDFRGGQLTGVYSHIGGDARGVVLAGFGSRIRGDFLGVQASLIANFNEGYARGLQYSSLLNFTSGGFRGLQWAGTLNMNDGVGAGWQLSSVANVSNDRFVGIQTAGFFNFGNVELKGGQVGAVNWTRHLKGAQIGVLNIAGDARGLQFGLVNITEQNDGIPVGLVNVAGNGSQDWITTGSNYMGVETGVRTIVNDWYSILSIGGLYTKETDLNAVSVGWNYGYRFGLRERLSLSVDAGYRHLIPEKDPALNDRLRPAAQGRAFLEFAVNEVFALHAGAGGNYEWSEYASDAETTFDPLFFGGISLFGGEER